MKLLNFLTDWFNQIWNHQDNEAFNTIGES